MCCICYKSQCHKIHICMCPYISWDMLRMIHKHYIYYREPSLIALTLTKLQYDWDHKICLWSCYSWRATLLCFIAWPLISTWTGSISTSVIITFLYICFISMVTKGNVLLFESYLYVVGTTGINHVFINANLSSCIVK